MSNHTSPIPRIRWSNPKWVRSDYVHHTPTTTSPLLSSHSSSNHTSPIWRFNRSKPKWEKCDYIHHPPPPLTSRSLPLPLPSHSLSDHTSPIRRFSRSKPKWAKCDYTHHSLSPLSHSHTQLSMLPPSLPPTSAGDRDVGCRDRCGEDGDDVHVCDDSYAYVSSPSPSCLSLQPLYVLYRIFLFLFLLSIFMLFL